jgi:hypothetical protein
MPWLLPLQLLRQLQHLLKKRLLLKKPQAEFWAALFFTALPHAIEPSSRGALATWRSRQVNWIAASGFAFLAMTAFFKDAYLA